MYINEEKVDNVITRDSQHLSELFSNTLGRFKFYRNPKLLSFIHTQNVSYIYEL
jgi:hypothetical protein